MKKPKKERKKFRITTLTALMLRFGIIVFILIYGATAAQTIAVSKDLLSQWEAYFDNHAGPEYQSEIPTITRLEMLEKCWDYGESAGVCHYSGNALYSKAFYDTAMRFQNYPQDVAITATSHVYLDYMTEETWINNISKPDGQVMVSAEALDFGSAFPEAVRLRGYYEDGFFVPIQVAYHEETNSHLFLQTIPQRDQLGYITWHILTDNTEICDRELVTIYTTNIYRDYSHGGSFGTVEYKDSTYVDLTELVREEYFLSSPSDSLWETVMLRTNYYKDETGDVFYQTTALRCYPVKMAAFELRWIYWGANVLFISILVLYYITLQRQLRNPIQRILNAGKGFTPLDAHGRSRWREVAQLEDGYERTQQTIHNLRQENQQLRTALEYAQEAEIRRRELVSGITHDLKTPLAIIHSYAEGLEAGIAPEKQTEYMQTILSETERMDAMVLEMLDFSRLEAGKVTLATDQFSLLALTKRVFERLNLQLAEKNLTVHYEITEDFLTTADEARIEQVVTNFATNAVKFTPEGGNIYLHIFRHTGKTMFTMANDCENLPEEALERIWDSFYRADTSRTIQGTGLGLPIARAIIHLHQGTCEARNTFTGIEFRFTLPQ